MTQWAIDTEIGGGFFDHDAPSFLDLIHIGDYKAAAMALVPRHPATTTSFPRAAIDVEIASFLLAYLPDHLEMELVDGWWEITDRRST